MAVTANGHLRKLLESATRESMMAALAGDERRATEALNTAMAAGVKQGDIDLINGLVALNQGDLEQAIALARRSIGGESAIQSADRVGALSLLANAQYWSFRVDETEVQINELLKMRPQKEIEKLLHASAIVGFSPLTTLELLAKEPDIARTPVGLFVRGQAGIIHAYDQSNEQELMEAFSDLRATHFLLGNSVAARRWYAIAVSTVIAMALSDGRAGDAESYMSLGISLADQLGADPNSQWIRWNIYRRAGENKKATEACLRAPSHGWCGFVAADCLLNDDYAAALQRFDRWCNGNLNKHIVLARSHLAVGDAKGRKWVREQVQPLLADPSPLLRRHAISALCLVCTPAEIREYTKKANQSPSAEFDSLHDLWAGDYCLQFFAEPDSPEPLLARAKGHRLALGNAHYTIAMMSLARGDREAAFEHFRQCHELRLNTIDGVLGSMYYERMSKSENWPAWLHEKATQQREVRQ